MQITHPSFRSPDAAVHAAGDLDIFDALQLRRALSDAASVGCTRIDVDLSGVGFVDVSALGLLSRAWQDLGRSGSRLVLVASSPRFQRMSTRSGLAGTWNQAA